MYFSQLPSDHLEIPSGRNKRRKPNMKTDIRKHAKISPLLVINYSLTPSPLSVCVMMFPHLSIHIMISRYG